MAIYSLCTTPFSRSAGTSAIAKAAYRAGERLLDRFYGEVCNYSRKAGVIFKEIFCPDNQKISRQDLWNFAEAAEKRKDARTAREIRIALPHELNEKERENLAVKFAQELVKKYGIAIDLCIHLPDKHGDQRNHHAHLLLTTRKLSKAGLGEKSDLERSDKYLAQHGKPSGKTQVLEIRKLWEDFCNLSLQRNGIEEQITAQSYESRGLDKEATIHLGPDITAMERKGINTRKGMINRAIIFNNNLRQYKQELIRLKNKIFDLINYKEKLKKYISGIIEKSNPISKYKTIEQKSENLTINSLINKNQSPKAQEKFLGIEELINRNYHANNDDIKRSKDGRER